VSLNLDSVADAETNAVKLQEIDKITNAPPTEVRGRVQCALGKADPSGSRRRHHGNIKSSDGADYPGRKCTQSRILTIES